MNRQHTIRLVLGGLLLIGGLLLGAHPALAHSGTPLKTVSQRLGPYPVKVHYYSEPRGGQALQFTIVPDGPQVGTMQYTVTAIPGTLVDAVPVKAHLSPDPDNPSGIAGTVNLPVSGQWVLFVEVNGPLGATNGDVPILAGAPPAIPAWLGWAIGLVPVWAMLGFVAVRGLRARPVTAERAAVA